MLWFCCVAIGFGHFEAKFEADLTCYSCSWLTVFATAVVILEMSVVISLTMHSLRHEFAIWLRAQNSHSDLRPLRSSICPCTPSNPKMAALSFAFITFAMLASQSASSRQREDHLLMLQPQLTADEQLSKVTGFLELHLFMFAPISPRPLLVLPWEKWKQWDCCFLFF